ncbi:MAG TPA: MFS transporter [Pirellulaceae bacterium]|nr:MFS transporter [Pirellulaceae bacterium]
MPTSTPRRAWFRWYVCGLLLLATTINYMDRQTLANTSVRIIEQFGLAQEQYGDLEMWFGYAFAFGSIFFGVLADYISIRWLYALVLVAWSVMGIATGWAKDFEDLLVCRTLLGFFEAGHWPCALRTTQVLLSTKERGLGNSILQSGSSIGAIVTPVIVITMLTDSPESWRVPFQVIGAIGLIWAVFWLTAMRGSDWRVEQHQSSATSLSPVQLSVSSIVRRLLVLVVVVTAINVCWQLFRAWLPLFLQRGRGYSEEFALGFTSVYYLMTDVGCLLAGWATVVLHRGGWSTGKSRWVVFTICALLTALSVGVALTPASGLLLAQLLLLGAGALGLFPCFYALSQEVSARHQGKITGMLGFIAWASSAPVHKYFGRYVDQYQTYDLGIAIVGCLPLVAAIVWLLLWDWRTGEVQSTVRQVVDE